MIIPVKRGVTVHCVKCDLITADALLVYQDITKYFTLKMVSKNKKVNIYICQFYKVNIIIKKKIKYLAN